MSAIDGYVGDVLEWVPRCLPARARIEADLRSHLADRVEAGESEAAAVSRMGAPEDVAREFLAQLDLRPATLLRRGAAFLIDVALGLVLLAPVLLLASVAFEGGLDWGTVPPWFTILIVAGVALALSIPVLSVVYFPLLEGLWGQTIGKRAVGICVVKETGERADWAAVIIRRFPFYFDFFWLDALFAPFTKRRQRAFDLVARTLVVRIQARRP